MAIVWTMIGLTWCVMIGLSLAVLALYRHFGLLYMNQPTQKLNQGPPVGSSLLSIGAEDVTGDWVSAPVVGRPTILLFADTDCDLCAELRNELRSQPLPGHVDVVVACSGLEKDVRAWGEHLPVQVRVVFDRKSRFADRYGVNGTPFAVIAGPDGVVVDKSIVNGQRGLEWMLETALESPERVEDLPMPVVRSSAGVGNE